MLLQILYIGLIKINKPLSALFWGNISVVGFYVSYNKLQLVYALIQYTKVTNICNYFLGKLCYPGLGFNKRV